MKNRRNLIPAISIGLLEVFKATVGFFTWITLKGCWEKYRAKKGQNADREVSREE